MPSALTVTSFLRGALRRLPVETAVIALAVLTSIHVIHFDDANVWHARLLLTAVLALPLVFALHERAPHLAVVGGAALTALTGLVVALVLPEMNALSRPAAQWTLLLLMPAAYLVPFIAAAPRFSLFVRRFFEEVTTWSLIGFVSLSALYVLGYAVAELFDVRTDRFTLELMLVTAGGISLLVLDRLLPDRAAAGKVPELWRRLATAIGAPFVSVMLIILFTYEVSVIFRGELPRNQLSPLLVGAGFAGFLCTLIISAVAAEPVGTDALSPAEPHRFLRNRSVQLARAFPLALLLLLPMAIWAIYVRIDQYGLTPFRVVRLAALLCLVVLSVLGSLRWLRQRAALGWHVPATIAAFALPLALGPTSAVNLSIYSQAARVERLLAATGVSHRRVGPETTEVAHLLREPEWSELESSMAQLIRLGREPALRRVLEGELPRCLGHYLAAEECLHGLGIGQLGVVRDEPIAKVAEPVASVAEPAASVAEPAERIPYPIFEQRYGPGPFTAPAGELIFVDFASFVDEDTAAPAGATSALDTIYLACGKGWATASLAPLLAITVEPGAALPNEPVILTGDSASSCIKPGRLFIQYLSTITDEHSRHAFRVRGVLIR